MKNILIGKREFIQITGIQIGLILINMPEMFVYVFPSKYNLKNGAPVSHIIKTFKLKENRTSEELESMPNYLKPNYNDYNLEKDYHLILKPKKIKT